MSESERIVNVLKRIETWAVAQGATLGLRDAASEADVASLEAELGRPLPADYRAFLLLHDGQDSEVATMPWLTRRAHLQPITTCVEQWRFEHDTDADGVEGTDDDGAFHLTVVSPLRYPIAGSQWLDGDNTYLDFYPGPAGVEGQLLGLVSECDWELFGASFGAALEEYARALDAGELAWDADEGPIPT